MEIFERNEKALAAEREKDKRAEKENGSNVFYTLKPGRTVLRVLPPYSSAGVWFREMHEYYFKLGDQHLFLTSPRDFDQADPLWDWGESVYEKGNEKAVEEAKRFRPTTRFLMNVLVLSDSQNTDVEDGVKVLKAPVTVKRPMVDIDTDVDTGYGDITNLNSGFNIVVDREGEGTGTKYTVKPQRERSDILQLLAQAGVDAGNLNLHDLDAVHLDGVRAEEELLGILEQVKGKVQPAAVEAVPIVVGSPLPLTATATAPVTGPVMSAPEGVSAAIPNIPQPPIRGGK